MATPNYRNAPAPAVAEVPKQQTVADPFTHGQNEVDAAAAFNARVDRRAQQGYSYHGYIPVSPSSGLLVFTRWG